MTATHQRIVLASRPQGRAVPGNFRLETQPVPVPGPGQMLVRNHYLSLDPYMRARMDDAKSYAAAQALDDTMVGGTVGVVEASNVAGYAPGDTVVGMLGWQEYGLSDGSGIMKVDASRLPMSAFLGPVGMPGVTAWYGMRRICEPRAGETVLVSAASGAVGSVAGQLAKRAGCRTIGIAGGPEKCRHVVEDLGFDACLDHREHPDVRSMSAALKRVAPDGIDCLFENVGGVGLDAALTRMNPHSRIALCGLIAGYNGEDIALRNVRLLIVMRIRLQGFIVTDHLEHWPAALQELGAAVANGQLRYRETIAEGLAAAPEAFIGMLQGRNLGKQLVRLI
jgi:NADPH-dependent curcumin reductase CurA